MPVYKKILVQAKFQYHTNVPLGVCDRHTEMVSSSTKNGGLADSETLNIPYSPCFPYIIVAQCVRQESRIQIRVEILDIARALYAIITVT